MMTTEIDSDHMICIKYAISLILSSTYHFLTNDSLQYANKDQQESRAVAGKLHVRWHRKIRYVSKFTVASRDSPCDSMAFLLCNWHYFPRITPGYARSAEIAIAGLQCL